MARDPISTTMALGVTTRCYFMKLLNLEWFFTFLLKNVLYYPGYSLPNPIHFVIPIALSIFSFLLPYHTNSYGTTPKTLCLLY